MNSNVSRGAIRLMQASFWITIFLVLSNLFGFIDSWVLAFLPFTILGGIATTVVTLTNGKLD